MNEVDRVDRNTGLEEEDTRYVEMYRREKLYLALLGAYSSNLFLN